MSLDSVSINSFADDTQLYVPTSTIDSRPILDSKSWMAKTLPLTAPLSQLVHKWYCLGLYDPGRDFQGKRTLGTGWTKTSSMTDSTKGHWRRPGNARAEALSWGSCYCLAGPIQAQGSDVGRASCGLTTQRHLGASEPSTLDQLDTICRVQEIKPGVWFILPAVSQTTQVSCYRGLLDTRRSAHWFCSLSHRGLSAARGHRGFGLGHVGVIKTGSPMHCLGFSTLCDASSHMESALWIHFGWLDWLVSNH